MWSLRNVMLGLNKWRYIRVFSSLLIHIYLRRPRRGLAVGSCSSVQLWQLERTFWARAAKIRRAAAPLPPLPPLRGLRHGFVLGKSRGKPWKTLQIPCIVASPDVTVCLVWTGSRVTNVTRKPWNHPRWSHHLLGLQQLLGFCCAISHFNSSTLQ